MSLKHAQVSDGRLRLTQFSADLPTLRFRPMNKTMVVREDPLLYDQLYEHIVRNADGTPALGADGEVITLELLTEYGGVKRIPDLRRGQIVKLPDRMLQEGGVEWVHAYHTELRERWNEHLQAVRPVADLVELRRFDKLEFGPGSVVWWNRKDIGLNKFVEDGIEYVLIGAHQVDFIECTDGEAGIDPTLVRLI